MIDCVTGLPGWHFPNSRNLALFKVVWHDQMLFGMSVRAGAQPGGGAFGAFAPPEIFKTLYSDFGICGNFPITKLKFCILIMFKSCWKVLLEFSMFYLPAYKIYF